MGTYFALHFFIFILTSSTLDQKVEYKEHKIADISVKRVPDCINYVADIKGSNKVMASSGSFKVEKYIKRNNKDKLIVQ